MSQLGPSTDWNFQRTCPPSIVVGPSRSVIVDVVGTPGTVQAPQSLGQAVQVSEPLHAPSPQEGPEPATEKVTVSATPALPVPPEAVYGVAVRVWAPGLGVQAA